jgi:hypothetical protein
MPALLVAQPGDVAVRFAVESGVELPVRPIVTDCVLGEMYFAVRAVALVDVAGGTTMVIESVPEPGAGVATAVVAAAGLAGATPPPPPQPPRNAAAAQMAVPAAMVRTRHFIWLGFLDGAATFLCWLAHDRAPAFSES